MKEYLRLEQCCLQNESRLPLLCYAAKEMLNITSCQQFPVKTRKGKLRREAMRGLSCAADWDMLNELRLIKFCVCATIYYLRELKVSRVYESSIHVIIERHKMFSQSFDLCRMLRRKPNTAVHSLFAPIINHVQVIARQT